MNPVLERKPWDVHSGIFAVSAVCLGKRTTAVNGKRKGSLLYSIVSSTEFSDKLLSVNILIKRYEDLNLKNQLKIHQFLVWDSVLFF